LIRPIGELELEGRRVLLRVDFNCPLDAGGVADDARIRAALPTIRHALKRRAKLVIMSHLGRPGGAPDPALSLEPVGTRLAELLDTDVVLADDCVGDGARKVVSDLYGGRIAMLENLRFHAGERAGDERFARQLADLGDVYVNDAFGAAHRTDASIALLPRLVEERCAGLTMMKELESLGQLVGDVRRPYVAVLGGAKISDKVRLVHSLLGRVDALVVGGAMANTFLGAGGLPTGRSLVEQDCFVHARGVLVEAKRRSVRVLLPVDVVVSSGPEDREVRVVPAGEIDARSMALDVGPATVEAFSAEVQRAGTIFWNGPLGLYERPPFDAGTLAMAGAIARSMAYSVVVGGDSVAAVRRGRLESRFGHLSTGGGASLAFVGGQELPGVKALEE
jgi:phosphoglycerate kinase